MRCTFAAVNSLAISVTAILLDSSLSIERMAKSRRTKESKVLCILLIIFANILPTKVVEPALVKFPNNTAVTDTINGTEFRCRSDQEDELQWFFQPNDTAHRQQLSSGHKIMSEQTKSYCDIQNEESGEFNLILKIQDESAQTYTCQEPNTKQERSAEVIKIEPIQPNRIGKKINASHVILNCSVKFRGNWAPELEWSHNGTSVVEGAEVFVVANQNVSSFLIIPRNDSTLAGNYSCTARFDLRGKPKQTTDNSVPSYMDTSILTVHVEEVHQPGLPSGGNSKGSYNAMIIVCVVIGVVVAAAAGGEKIMRKKECNVNIEFCKELPANMVSGWSPPRGETGNDKSWSMEAGGLSTWVEVGSVARLRTTTRDQTQGSSCA